MTTQLHPRMNTRSSIRVDAELEKRGLTLTNVTIGQKRELYASILEVERVLATFNRTPTHSYNLRPRKTN